MARTQVQVKRQPINSWDEADNALKEIAVIDETIKKEEAAYNEAEQEARAKLTTAHAPKLELKHEYELGLEDFVTAHRGDLGDKKTKKLKHGEVSFRLHPPAVKSSKGMTWAAVINLIGASKKWADKFLRVKKEINKDAIIAAHGAKTIKVQELTKLGMEIEQKESFGYDTSLAIGG